MTLLGILRLTQSVHLFLHALELSVCFGQLLIERIHVRSRLHLSSLARPRLPGD